MIYRDSVNRTHAVIVPLRFRSTLTFRTLVTISSTCYTYLLGQNARFFHVRFRQLNLSNFFLETFNTYFLKRLLTSSPLICIHAQRSRFILVALVHCHTIRTCCGSARRSTSTPCLNWRPFTQPPIHCRSRHSIGFQTSFSNHRRLHTYVIRDRCLPLPLSRQPTLRPPCHGSFWIPTFGFGLCPLKYSLGH